MRKGITKLELLLSGLLLLTLISYLAGFRANDVLPRPVAEVRHLQASVKPEISNPRRELPRAKGGTGVDEASAPVNPVLTARDKISSKESDLITVDEAAIPVVFVDPSPELDSTEGQPAEIDFLRQRFVELMSGIDQDPASPEYRRRWDEAQRQIDEEFMAFFGQEVFNEQQRKAVRAAGNGAGS